MIFILSLHFTHSLIVHDKNSAVLCAFAPACVPFMADESVLSVPGLGKLEYNLKHYMRYVEKIQEKVDILNAAGSSNVYAYLNTANHFSAWETFIECILDNCQCWSFSFLSLYIVSCVSIEHDDQRVNWTCHRVEKALWTYHLAKKYGVAIDIKTPTNKRGHTKQSSPPPAKRGKH